MIGLLTLQLVMGAMVVFYHLPSIVITIHLLIAMIFMSILIWFWRSEKFSVKQKLNRTTSKYLSTVIVLLFITFGLGAYIKHEHYGLACGWLACSSPLNLPELLQTAHRLLAFVVTCLILFITYKTFKDNDNRLKIRMVLTLIVILIQLALGVLTILSFVSLPMAVLHLAAGTLLFGLIIEARIIYSN